MTSQARIEFTDDGDGTAPEDAPRRRKQQRRAKAQAAPEAAPPDEPCYPPQPAIARVAIGRLSDCGHACQRCGADEYDVVEERFATVLGECAFCGLLCWIERPRSFRSAVIQSGQLKGLTVRQAVNENRRIVEHLAAKTPWIMEELRAIDGAPFAE